MVGIKDLKRLTRIQKILGAAAAAIVVFSVTGFLILPPIIKYVLQKELTKQLNRTTTVTQLRVNPYTLTLTVGGLAIKERGGNSDFASFDRMAVNLEILSLFKRALIIKSFTLDGLRINVTRNMDETYNFSDLTDGKKEEPGKKPGDKDSKPFSFSINNIVISNAYATFNDMPKGRVHTVKSLNLGVPFASNLQYNTDVYVTPAFSAVVNGTPVSLAGKIKPFSKTYETSLDIKIKKLDLPEYLKKYVPVKTGFEIRSAKLDTDITVSFSQRSEKERTLSVSGNIGITGVDLTEPKGGSFFKLASVGFTILPANLIDRKVHIGSIIVDAPFVSIERLKNGDIKPLTLLTVKDDADAKAPSAAKGPSDAKGQAAAKDEKDKDREQPLSLTVDMIKLTGGNVSFADLMPQKPFTTAIEDIDITVKNLSTDKDIAALYEASFKSALMDGFSLKGGLVVNPLSAGGVAEAKNLKIPGLAPYYEPFLNGKIPSGLISASAGYAFKTSNPGGNLPGKNLPGKNPTGKTPTENSITLTGASVTLEKLAVLDSAGKKVIDLPQFSVTGAELDLSGKTLAVGGVYTRGADIKAARDKDGGINLAALVKTAGAENPESKPPADIKTHAASDIKADATTRAKTDTAETPFKFSLKKAVAENYKISFDDAVPAQPVSVLLDNIKLTLENISNEKKINGAAALSFTLNKNGKMSLKSAISSLAPFKTSTQIDADGVEIKPFQNYFTDMVRVVVTDGSLSVKGTADVAQEEKGFKVSFNGDVSSSDFATVDQAVGADFLKWKRLALGGFSFDANPLAVSINRAELDGFYTGIVVAPDGSLNLKTVIANGAKGEAAGEQTSDVKPAQQSDATPDEKPSADKTAHAKNVDSTKAGDSVKSIHAAKGGDAAKGDSAAIKIAGINLNNCRIDFTDKKITPNYAASIYDLSGSVTGLSSLDTEAARISLNGKINRTAPLSISGSLNPFKEHFLVDLKVDTSGIDLSPVSPYSGRHIGYKIDKGALSLALKYNIESRKLNADNHVRIDQFTLGEKVESPDALKIPIGLAVALLQDGSGVIELDLPVSGSLDDPDFSIGGIVVKAIVNIIVKAATAPFALIGSLFGGGEELQFIEFDSGSRLLPPDGAKKLDALAKALVSRPSLKLDVVGRVDAERDRQALVSLYFERQVKARKMKEMVRRGDDIKNVDDVVIGKDEYEKYLKAAYNEAKIPGKPKNIVGMTKTIPPQEMKRLLLDNIKVTDDDLRLLAVGRADGIKAYLTETGKAPADRVFTVEPRTGNKGADDKATGEKGGKRKLPPARADLSLK